MINELVPKAVKTLCETLQSSCESPPHKKRRIVGPKSEMLKYEQQQQQQQQQQQPKRRIGPKSVMLKYQEMENKKLKLLAPPTPPTYVYQPLSLMNCALNAFNSCTCPNYEPEQWIKVKVTSLVCTCGHEVENILELAKHQVDHLYIVIGPKLDTAPSLSYPDSKIQIRKAWSQSNETSEEATEGEDTEGTEDGDFDQNLLIPVDTPEEPVPEHDICISNGIPTVNGRPLTEYSKEERKTFYHTIIHNGIKRKFCHLCRYTFKDNWSIECHYLSNSCYYTCRFCGARFTKYKSMFAEHLKLHKGQTPSSKIFGQLKKPTKTNPYVKRRPFMQQKVKTAKVKPTATKKQPELNPTKPTIKIEPISDYPQEKRRKTEPAKPKNDTGKSDMERCDTGKPYQAYFCRKCYKVFYKLDEFDVHVLACSGRMNTEETPPPVARISTPKPVSQKTTKPGPKSMKAQLYEDNPPIIDSPLSTSGRPIRNCVREITRYVDEPQLDPEWLDEEPAQVKTKVSEFKTENGYACGI